MDEKEDMIVEKRGTAIERILEVDLANRIIKRIKEDFYKIYTQFKESIVGVGDPMESILALLAVNKKLTVAKEYQKLSPKWQTHVNRALKGWWADNKDKYEGLYEDYKLVSQRSLASSALPFFKDGGRIDFVNKQYVPFNYGEYLERKNFM